MRSKHYQALIKKIDRSKSYSVDEAIKLVKETAKVKFDASVEVHLPLGIDASKGEQSVRGNVVLPHGTGKSKKVAVFVQNEKIAKEAGAEVVGSDELIKAIISLGKADFDVALASPAMMKKLAGAAKVLGPKGLMPSPKAGTVVEEEKLAKAVEEIKKGKVNFRSDDTGNIHQALGKASWDDGKLKENFEVFIEAVNRAKPAGMKGVFIKAIYLTSTMGPAVRVNV